MRAGVGALGLVVALAVGHAATGAEEKASTPLRQAPSVLRSIGRADLDVTLGKLEQEGGRLVVESSKFRAVAKRRTEQLAELDFTFLGPTKDEAPLASGEMRRQLGLKLRAADGCNLVYVMWRIAPRQQLVVSIKRNPGASTHAQCGAGGYRNVRANHVGQVPRLEPGVRHTLRAEIDGERLVVQIDGKPAWEGMLGAEIRAFDGPVGLRTDNARIAFQLRLP